MRQQESWKMSETPVKPSPITIRAETSIADPDSCKFTVNRTVHPDGPFLFDDPAKAEGSPLIERLFALQGVTTVLVADSVVTVGKAGSVSWDALRADIGGVIRSQLLTGVRAIFQAPRPAPGNRNDDEIRVAVQELLDRETNPSIAAHGGKISIIEVKDRELTIEMSGGCQGCAASQLTLRQGFEVMVRRAVPEIVKIIDGTDHSSGSKPFYEKADG
jgi:Fe-S cluster biogenesis protein NfuA